jgi:hypothetical protein
MFTYFYYDTWGGTTDCYFDDDPNPEKRHEFIDLRAEPAAVDKLPELHLCQRTKSANDEENTFGKPSAQNIVSRDNPLGITTRTNYRIRAHIEGEKTFQNLIIRILVPIGPTRKSGWIICVR